MLGNIDMMSLEEIQVMGCTSMESRRPWIQAGSWMAPAHMGPPIWNPLPVSGQVCGTAGPAPGPYLVLLPFTNCALHRKELLFQRRQLLDRYMGRALGLLYALLSITSYMHGT